MKSRKQTSLVLGVGSAVLSLIMLLPTAVGAEQADADEAKLQVLENEMDSGATAAPDKSKVETLAQQFKVDPNIVEGLRRKGGGWGEMVIHLAMAQRLTKTDPKTYPTLADALQRVQTLRAEGKGWGAIAKELRFKLGPVISEVKRAQPELRRTDRMEKGRPELPMGSNHSNRAERADRPRHMV